VLNDKESLVVAIPKDTAHDVINNRTDSLSFKVPARSDPGRGPVRALLAPEAHPTHPCLQFDGVLENASQEAVYEACGQDVVEGVLGGYNGTIMCYGQVGRRCVHATQLLRRSPLGGWKAGRSTWRPTAMATNGFGCRCWACRRARARRSACQATCTATATAAWCRAPSSSFSGR
jgi:hypothetical protein